MAGVIKPNTSMLTKIDFLRSQMTYILMAEKTEIKGHIGERVKLHTLTVGADHDDCICRGDSAHQPRTPVKFEPPGEIQGNEICFSPLKPHASSVKTNCYVKSLHSHDEELASSVVASL